MTDKIKIWDLPLRLFHWLLVVAIAGAWFSIEILEDVQIHFYFGYAVLALLLFRLLWGFVGTHYSRFRRLFFAPSDLFNYIRSLWSGSSPSRYAGHNPLGSLSVIALLGLMGFQVGTGLFSTDDYFYGPLAGLVSTDRIDQLTALHHDNFEWLQILIGLHIVAILLYRLLKKEQLTSAMITGKKTGWSESRNHAEIRSDRLILAVVLVLLCVFTTYAIVNWLAEPVPITDSYLY